MCGWENVLWFSSSVRSMHAQVTSGEMYPRASVQEPSPIVSSPSIIPIFLNTILCRLSAGTGYLSYAMPCLKGQRSRIMRPGGKTI